MSTERQQQRKEEVKELDKHIRHKQTLCSDFDDVQTAISELEERGRRLTEQQKQLNQLEDELCKKEKCLCTKEEGLQQKEEELQQKEEELVRIEEKLHVKELLKKDEDFSEEDEVKEFYLSTAGLRSDFDQIGTEEEKWEVELQREKLRQQEDRLKVNILLTPVKSLKITALKSDSLSSSCGGSSALQVLDSAGEPERETPGDRGEFTGAETQTGPAGLSANTHSITHTPCTGNLKRGYRDICQSLFCPSGAPVEAFFSLWCFTKRFFKLCGTLCFSCCLFKAFPSF